MGGSRIDSEDVKRYYDTHSHIRSATNYNQVFKGSRMKNEYNPSLMKLPREACDSVDCPHSRGIIYCQDVTGSMGDYSLSLIKNEFPRLIKLTHESVSYDPHIMYMGVGDVEFDSAPLQVTQFEADLRMLEQLQEIYIEGGGGSNPYESYILPWYFAGNHIEMDCYKKRGEKGFLFTFGDELPTPHLTASQLSKVFGKDELIQTRMVTAEDCLEMASSKFYCYHVILHGWYYEHHNKYDLREQWRDLLGGHVCDLSDHHYLPELVTTILRMYEGYSKTEYLSCISDNEAKNVVKDALKWHEEVVVDEKEERKSRNVELF